jgi:hypothetical protein
VTRKLSVSFVHFRAPLNGVRTADFIRGSVTLYLCLLVIRYSPEDGYSGWIWLVGSGSGSGSAV